MKSLEQARATFFEKRVAWDMSHYKAGHTIKEKKIMVIFRLSYLNHFK